MDVQIDRMTFSCEKHQNNILQFSSGINNALSVAESRTVLLRNIDMHICAGHVTAVFGDDPVALHALIQIVALRQTRGYMEGSIYFDTVSRTSGLYRDIAYVPDHDDCFHFERLRVFESLYFAARLRTQLSELECRERAREISRFLELDGSGYVGNLSETDIRLLHIGAELVGNPSFLCLQYPTEGLDAVGALTVCRTLYRISKRTPAITVLYSMPPPSAEMLRFTDDFAVLLQTEAVFCGPHLRTDQFTALAALASFELLHLTPSSSQSTAQKLHLALQQMMDLCPRTGSVPSASPGRYNGPLSPGRGSMSSPAPASSATSPARRQIRDYPLPVRIFKPFLLEVFLLISRAWRYTKQTKYQLRMSVGRLTISGLVIGVILFNAGSRVNDSSSSPVDNSGDVEDSTYDVTSSLFAVLAMTIVGVSLAVPFMHSHVRLLRQEVACGLHRIFSCWLALLTLDIPIYILAATVMATLMYEMVSVSSASADFFGTILLVTLVSYSMAGACAVTFKSPVTALRVFGALGFFELLMTGYVQRISEMPGAWSWMSTVSFTRWGLQALMRSTYNNDSQEAYLETFSFHDESIGTCFSWLAVWLGIFQGIVLLSLSPPLFGMKVEPSSSGSKRRRASTIAAQAQVQNEIKAQTSVLSPLRGDTSAAGIAQPFSSAFMIASPTSTLCDISLASPKDAVTIDQLETAVAANSNSNSNSINSSIPRDDDSSGPLWYSLQRHAFPVVPVPSKMQADLVFTRVKYLSESADGRPDVVVHSVTGRVPPGSSCAILSGSRDRTADILLRVLGGRTGNIGTVLGSLTVNDAPLTEYYVSAGGGSKEPTPRLYPKRINSAYVLKGDSILWPELTVREALLYSALLKRTDQRSCPNLQSVRRAVRRLCGGGGASTGSTSRYSLTAGGSGDTEGELGKFDAAEMVGNSAEVKDRVQEVISMLLLDDVADRKVGSIDVPDVGSSSGATCASILTRGRRRLLTIAQELVNRPGLILLEDPVHGLSWDEAEEVASAIVALARGGRTVLCSLTFPSSAVLSAFDSLLLLGGGLQLYFGPRKEAVAYFENIGFENSVSKSPAEFLLEIAAERGVIKAQDTQVGQPQNQQRGSRNQPHQQQRGGGSSTVNWKGAAVNLNLEDLADLARSLCNVSTFSSSANLQGKNSAAEESFFKAIRVIKSDDKKSGIPMLYVTPALQPTARVLVHRGFRILSSDYWSIVIYIARALLAGIILGTVWFRIDNSNYQVKLNLFACTYIFVNLALVDLFDGLHRRLSMFRRERDVGSSSCLAYWLSDPSPSFVINSLSCLVVSLPVYILAELRGSGIEYFGYFFVLLLSSVYCNSGFAFLLSTFTSSAVNSRLVFNGVVMPLQIVFSGFLFLLPAMAGWFSWISYLCPMSYFLAGLLGNEYESNDQALGGTLVYEDLQDIYGFHIGKYSALVVIIGIGFIYKLIWLLALILQETATDIRNMRKLSAGKTRFMSRRILSAGLRWRGNRARPLAGSKGTLAGATKGAMYSSAFMESSDDYLSGLEMDMFDDGVVSTGSSQRGSSWTGTMRSFFTRKGSEVDAGAKSFTKRSMPGIGPIDVSSRGDESRHGQGGVFGVPEMALFEDDSSAYHEL